jgi:hypothetical protein
MAFWVHGSFGRFDETRNSEIPGDLQLGLKRAIQSFGKTINDSTQLQD